MSLVEGLPGLWWHPLPPALRPADSGSRVLLSGAPAEVMEGPGPFSAWKSAFSQIGAIACYCKNANEPNLTRVGSRPDHRSREDSLEEANPGQENCL